MSSITTIGFDADDTLWKNEHVFKLTQARFTSMLSGHGEAEHISSRLLAAERRNLSFYGFGIKGFMLSMIETAIEVTDGHVPASIIADILAAGREMLRHPVETLPAARETLQALAGCYKLVLITKGDLFDQERKLAQSGLGELFDAVEIVNLDTAWRQRAAETSWRQRFDLGAREDARAVVHAMAALSRSPPGFRTHQIAFPEWPGAALQRAEVIDRAAAFGEDNLPLACIAGLFLAEEDTVVLAAGVADFSQ